MNIPPNERLETLLLVVENREMPYPRCLQASPGGDPCDQLFPPTLIAYRHHPFDPLEPFPKLILWTHRLAKARFVREISQIHTNPRSQTTLPGQFRCGPGRPEIP